MSNFGLLDLNKNADSTQYLIDALEQKDSYTQGHSHHVNVIVKVIYDCLPLDYKKKLDEEKLLAAALLHDIGKIMVPDEVLNKEGALDADEWEEMKKHPLNSKNIVDNTVFSYMGNWILYHHERIDGKGYYGLKGDEIPLESRIISIADTFSALRTYRVYRPAFSIEKTIEIMKSASGSQFDEEILRYFLSIDESVLEKLECNCEICRMRREALEAIGELI